MTAIYSGKCKGGPHDGKMMTHHSSRKELLTPVMLGIWPNDNMPILPVRIGEYYWAAHNYWQWRPTREGKAIDTLRRRARAEG